MRNRTGLAVGELAAHFDVSRVAVMNQLRVLTEAKMANSPKSVTSTFIKAPIETVWSTLIATETPLPFFFGSVCQTTNGR